MNISISLKRISALALAIALFLPLIKLKVEKMPYMDFSAYNFAVQTSPGIKGEWMGTMIMTLIYDFAFLWPLALVVVSKAWPALRRKRAVLMAELALSASSGFILTVFFFNGHELRYGLYIAAAAVTAYFIAVAYKLAAWTRRT